MIRVESKAPNPFAVAWTLATCMPMYDDVMRLVLAWALARCERFSSLRRMYCTHCLRADGAYMVGKPFALYDDNGYLLDGATYTVGQSGKVIYAPPSPVKFRIPDDKPKSVPMYRQPPNERLIYRTQLDDTDELRLLGGRGRSSGIRRSSSPPTQPKYVWKPNRG